MAKERRVFLVNIEAGDGPKVSRLIRAKGPASAKAHVADGLITANEATPQELVELGAAGVKIEETE